MVISSSHNKLFQHILMLYLWMIVSIAFFVDQSSPFRVMRVPVQRWIGDVSTSVTSRERNLGNIWGIGVHSDLTHRVTVATLSRAIRPRSASVPFSGAVQTFTNQQVPLSSFSPRWWLHPFSKPAAKSPRHRRTLWTTRHGFHNSSTTVVQSFEVPANLLREKLWKFSNGDFQRLSPFRQGTITAHIRTNSVGEPFISRVCYVGNDRLLLRCWRERRHVLLQGNTAGQRKIFPGSIACFWLCKCLH